MDYIGVLRNLQRNPRVLIPLVMLPLILLVLMAVPSAVFVQEMDAIWGDSTDASGILDYMLGEAGSLESTGFADVIFYGLDLIARDDEAAYSDDIDLKDYYGFYPLAPRFALGFMGFGGSGLQDTSLSSILLWVAMVIWAAIGLLFMMGLARLLYVGRWSFRQFRGVFTKRNVAISLGAPLLLFQLGAAAAVGFFIVLPLGAVLFTVLPFLAVDNDLSTSGRLAARRLKEMSTYKVMAIVYVLVIIPSLVFGALMYAINESAIVFVLGSVTLVGVAALQSAGMYSILKLSSKDPETRRILEKQEREKAVEKDRLGAAEKTAKEMKVAGKSDMEIKSELRDMRLSIEEIEEIVLLKHFSV